MPQDFCNFCRSVSVRFFAFACLLAVAGCGGVSGKLTSAVPTISISANPATVAAGGASTLSVTAANATKVTVAGSDGSSYTLPEGGGTQTVNPTATTTYTATATGAGGSATANSTITVSSVGSATPTVTITASPASITAGSSSILTITATNATGVSLSGSDGSTYTIGATGGTQAVTPSSNHYVYSHSYREGYKCHCDCHDNGDTKSRTHCRDIGESCLNQRRSELDHYCYGCECIPGHVVRIRWDHLYAHQRGGRHTAGESRFDHNVYCIGLRSGRYCVSIDNCDCYSESPTNRNHHGESYDHHRRKFLNPHGCGNLCDSGQREWI